MKTILFVPAPGDKHGLLSPGKCGARPPRMRGHKNHQGKITHWDSEEPNPEWEDVSALVLALEGEPVPGGIFHLWWQADDVNTDELMEMLEGKLENIVEIASKLFRDDKPLGEVLVLV